MKAVYVVTSSDSDDDINEAKKMNINNGDNISSINVETSSNVNVSDKDSKSELKCWQNPMVFLRIILIAFSFTVCIMGIIHYRDTKKLLDFIFSWIPANENYLEGALLLSGFYFITSMFMIPGTTLLTVTVGALYIGEYGIVKGLSITVFTAYIGTLFGSITAFTMGRYLFQAGLNKLKIMYPKFCVIERIIIYNGFKITFLIRLSPIIPAHMMNYFMGITGIRFLDYLVGSLGFIPSATTFALIGGSIEGVISARKVGIGYPKILIATIIGSIFSFFFLVYLSYIAKRELKRMAREVRNESNEYNINGTQQNVSIKRLRNNDDKIQNNDDETDELLVKSAEYDPDINVDDNSI
mmetsp:Transcript_2716/g.3342  ORF Transcript_2716/g.3342 Transcript_2716/m.3342 type:complete len:354 (-) Transcript_2716:975-2036(-)